MSGKSLRLIVLAAALAAAPSSLAFARSDSGLEVGVRTGYAFSAGHLGKPSGESDDHLSNWITGQWPIWVDAGYRFNPFFYLGGYFQYGFGFVNDDRQDLCRADRVECSASDIRLGIMGRYNMAPTWPLSPWFGLGMGYEWGSFSLHQSVIGNTDTDSSWDGFEILNLQAGADYRLAYGFVVAPFVSFSLGQFQSRKNTTKLGSTTTTDEQDLESQSFHEWILLGVRVAFAM
jgi:hypothetical protein